jgi:hypothetical protein
MRQILFAWAILASSSLRAAGGPGEEVLPLKPVVSGEDDEGIVLYEQNRRIVQLDREGRGEIDFATPSGKLRFRVLENGVAVDRDGDGTIDRAEGDILSDGAVVKVPVQLAGKTFPYPIAINALRLSGGGNRGLALIQGRVHLEAGTGATKIALLDSNLNGRFGDRHGKASAGEGDMLRIGDGSTLRPCTTHVEIGDSVRTMEIAGGGESIVLRRYSGPLSTLKVEAVTGWKTEASLWREDGGFAVDVKSGGEARLLPGAYRIARCGATHTAKKLIFFDSADVIFYGPASEARPVSIAEGANTWRMGPPFQLLFTAKRSTEDDDDVDITDVSIAGQGGDSYPVNNCSSNQSTTITAHVRAGSKEKKVAALTYG